MILLEKPGVPAHDDATGAQIRALVTKGARMGEITDSMRIG